MHSPNAKLQALLSDYPLSDRWGAPELFTETIHVAGADIQLVGLCVRDRDGREVTGSAAARTGVPLRRAYFELIERTSVVDAVDHPKPAYPLLDETRAEVGVCRYTDLFPTADPAARFRYSLSNGVAAELSFHAAARAAVAELVERDRVLRSWFGEIAPVPVPVPCMDAFSGLSALYRIEAFAIPDVHGSVPPELEVAAVFGFPHDPTTPLLRGTGAGRTLAEALARAWQECVQSLGFLWGEPVPERPPDYTPCAEYHQEYFLYPGTHAKLREWLCGAATGRRSTAPRPRTLRARRFVDLTPEHLAGRCFVVKAMADSELPLVFGRKHPSLLGEPPPGREIHPLA